MDENKTYTLKECEDIFHVTRVTLLKWVNTGKLPATKVGQKWLVTNETVKTLLNRSDV